MSKKVEEFIESRETSFLLPCDARKAAQIAREEVMVDVFYHLEVRLPEHLDYNGIVVERKDFIEDFKKVLMGDSI